MKKKMAIILAALVLGSFAACSTQENQISTDIAETVSVQDVKNTDDDTEYYSGDVSENNFSQVSKDKKSRESSPESSTEKSAVSENSKEYISENESTSPTADINSNMEETVVSESESSQKYSKKSENTSSTVNIDSKTEETVVSENESSREYSQKSENTNIQTEENSVKSAESSKTSVYTANTSGKLDTTDIFSNRDLAQTADTSGAVTITAQDNKTETITEEGVYVLTGSASNFTVKVEADKQAKIQLVLDGLNVTNTDFPVIYVISADKCFITTTSTSNSLSVTGTFKADGDTNTDAVIYSKDDIVFNGTGSLDIVSSKGNGISGKDDIKFTGGTYNIQSEKDSIEANDSILIYDGTFNITSAKDGLHSENSDDDSVGYIYIQNGTFTVKASSDAIQATTVCQIDGGTFSLTAAEGIEATYIQINDGTFDIYATDDGINGAQKSRSFGTPTIEFNGGYIKVAVGQGDTDAIDCNGNIIVNGGTIDVTAQMSSFDYDGTAQYNGGTIIVNGTQVDSIPQSMMGGGRGGMRGNFGRW